MLTRRPGTPQDRDHTHRAGDTSNGGPSDLRVNGLVHVFAATRVVQIVCSDLCVQRVRLCGDCTGLQLWERRRRAGVRGVPEGGMGSSRRGGGSGTRKFVYQKRPGNIFLL